MFYVPFSVRTPTSCARDPAKVLKLLIRIQILLICLNGEVNALAKGNIKIVPSSLTYADNI